MMATLEGFHPNAQAVARSLSSSTSTQQELMRYALACVQPSLQYFMQQTVSTMEGPLLPRVCMGFIP